MEVLDYIDKKQFDLQIIRDEANRDVPLNEDEYYESDAYYEGAIDALRQVLKEYGVIN